VVSDGSGRCRLRLPRLPVIANGAGDAIAALFFAQYLQLGSAAEAMAASASSMFGVLSRTAEEGSSEMLLVATQEEFVSPSRVFRTETI
jgi:pyridoxine kinase